MQGGKGTYECCLSSVHGINGDELYQVKDLSFFSSSKIKLKAQNHFILFIYFSLLSLKMVSTKLEYLQ